MEVMLVLGVVVLVFFAVAPKRGAKPSYRRVERRKKLPPVVRPAHPQPRRESGRPPPAMPSSREVVGRAWIIDGDTIAIKGTKIRLAGIDAPELDMPYGKAAKWAMVRICKGQTVTAKLDGERSFDRLVGTCYLPDGRDIGAELIKQGFALDLTRFSGGKYEQFEPAGARQKLANGAFGHTSIKGDRDTPAGARYSER